MDMLFATQRNIGLLICGLAFIALIFLIFVFIAVNYKKCPSNKILVIVGRINPKTGRFHRCLMRGAFVWPLIQKGYYLDLSHISVDLNLKRVKTASKQQLKFEASMIVRISIESDLVEIAAERLLGLAPTEIGELASDIAKGQVRLLIAQKELEQIDDDENLFLDELARNIEIELRKIGLGLVSINVEDIFEAGCD